MATSDLLGERLEWLDDDVLRYVAVVGTRPTGGGHTKLLVRWTDTEDRVAWTQPLPNNKPPDELRELLRKGHL